MGQTVKRLFSIIRCVIRKLFPQHFSLTKSIFSNFPTLAVSERQGPLQLAAFEKWPVLIGLKFVKQIVVTLYALQMFSTSSSCVVSFYLSLHLLRSITASRVFYHHSTLFISLLQTMKSLTSCSDLRKIHSCSFTAYDSLITMITFNGIRFVGRFHCLKKVTIKSLTLFTTHCKMIIWFISL